MICLDFKEGMEENFEGVMLQKLHDTDHSQKLILI